MKHSIVPMVNLTCPLALANAHSRLQGSTASSKNVQVIQGHLQETAPETD